MNIKQKRLLKTKTQKNPENSQSSVSRSFQMVEEFFFRWPFPQGFTATKTAEKRKPLDVSWMYRRCWNLEIQADVPRSMCPFLFRGHSNPSWCSKGINKEDTEPCALQSGTPFDCDDLHVGVPRIVQSHRLPVWEMLGTFVYTTWAV